MGTGGPVTVRLNINGTDHEVDADPDTPLAYALRDALGLKGTKIGCGLEQCGACTVLSDGVAVQSCVREVRDFEGCAIVTIEGIAETDVGQRVQQAFIDASAAQCGYCTSGMVVAVTALLEQDPQPDRTKAQEALTPHLCRCGAHPRILRAVEIASGQSS